MSLPSIAAQNAHRYACALCARRKVKCDKGDPCSNCLKARTQCVYEPPPPPRPRKRAADEDLLVRLARYEDLMRKHNVDFAPYVNTWVPSGLEGKLKEADSESEVSIWSTTAYTPENITSDVERCLWSNLSPELKHPPIQNLRYRDDPFLQPTPSLQSILTTEHAELHQLHPEPRIIYRFWQTFVECANPLTKIVHVPTLQQRVMDASWDVTHASKSLEAILFAVYTLAVTTMSSEECQNTLNESRGILLTRYRVATFRALIAADFLTTRDFEVMQAFALFLFADPESELTATLIGAALRLGHKMGLHRAHLNDSKFSFFEKEMRLRLWWQLRAMNSRSRSIYTPGWKPSLSDFNDLRLPLNVNDADLHPDMTEPPIEHSSPTEMLCILMKFGVSSWFRSSTTAAKVFNSIAHVPLRDKMSMKLENDAINELEAIYTEKYYRVCDERIPLHGLTIAMARLTIARMRFKIYHPRGRAGVGAGEVLMTQEELDTLFEAALTTLEMTDIGMSSKFSSHLFSSTHMTATFHLDAYIYVISDLRRRCYGERIDLAWKLIEKLYDEHTELINDTESTFFVALGDLTLEAWEARRKDLARMHDPSKNMASPPFIQSLWGKRQNGPTERVQISSVVDPQGFDSLGVIDDSLDWAYWSDFLQV